MRSTALWLAPLLVALATVAAGCRDSSVGPPPKKLNAEQSARVASALLAAPPAPAFPGKASFGEGKVRYLGSDLSNPTPARGARVEVTHYFASAGPLDGSWKLFVHLHSREGAMVLNLDHTPVEGLHPTDRWKEGQLIADRHSFTVPLDAPSDLTASLGFYRFERRLPLDKGEGTARWNAENKVEAFKLRLSDERGQLPFYRAKRRGGAIALDGVLDDPGWQGVASTGPFLRTGDGGTPTFRTEAMLTWDEEALYVAFKVEDEDLWAKLSKDDDPIYEEEVVELFIDADGDGKSYNELQLSPRGVKFDASFEGRRQGMNLAWGSGMTFGIALKGTLNDASDRDEGWTAELRVPVANLSKVPRWPPQEGDEWRFNLYRLEWHSERRVNEGSAFSPPMVGDFHNLVRFGRLVFGP